LQTSDYLIDPTPTVTSGRITHEPDKRPRTLKCPIVRN